MRPDLGHIEDIVLEVLSLLRVHNLSINIPNRIVSLFNCFEEILEKIVLVLAS